MSDHKKNAKVFKAFCDENRLMILSLLQRGEECACVLLEKLSIGQSTLSHHMKILCESGVVSGRKDGKWIFYSISTGGVERTKLLLANLTEVKENHGGHDGVACECQESGACCGE